MDKTERMLGRLKTLIKVEKERELTEEENSEVIQLTMLLALEGFTKGMLLDALEEAGESIGELQAEDMYFAKVKIGARIPEKREEDAGYDIYACFDEDFIIIPPHTTKMIPTGIASAMHPTKYIQLEERGSTGSKGIKRSAGVIDSGYRGEWFVALTNTNSKDLIISKIPEAALYGQLYLDQDGEVTGITAPWIFYPYKKAICQAIVHEVPVMNVQEVSLDDLQNIKSDRGAGKLGSSEK